MDVSRGQQSPESMRGKKIIAIIVAVAIVLVAVAGAIYYLTQAILIYNVYDLQNISKDGSTLNGHYALANDIDASVTRNWNNGAGFEPIGDYFTHFTGTFDGRGYKIIGLYINRPSEDYVGLFGYLGYMDIIKNVGMVGTEIHGDSNVGGLVGYNDGIVSNSYSTGTVSGGSRVGGLVGSNRGGIVSNSYATGNVSGNNSVGGLVGDNDGTVSNSYAMGNVSGGSRVGGLIGYNHGTINNSYATGNVSGSSVGGLVGINKGSISNCYGMGNVKGDRESWFVGGLVGYNEYNGSVSNSYAMGNVSGDYDVGGLMGSNYGTVSNSYAMGTVSGGSHVGGIVGVNAWRGSISKSYATGNVSGDYDVGGLVGSNYGTVTASFWDVDSSRINHSDGGTGKTTSEMKTKSTFRDVDWDFVNVWDIREGVSYPYLRWQEG